ncbi:cation:proton antiporter domain-containing protein [Nocardioides limicola]|uniref:cation:proton antiporter domain-containing protein n=1 Tax=Nocardioides limicola TaxID=2803368 RepID=UPI0027DDD09E|nr:cation:proton antiporter [Nocardioides sp. DJM-14]
MLTAVAFLAAAFLGGLGAGMLRLPPMVGFLAAGFVLHGIGVDELPALQTLADIGVVLLLFGIGLKLDVRSLLRREVWLTMATHMSASVAVGIGFLALLGVVGFSELEGAGFGVLALVAFALSFSSTVFVVKTLDDRGDEEARYGRVAIGILILQDVAAVAYITASKGDWPSPWALALVLLLPASRVFRWLWSRVGHGELQVVFGVLMALGPGWALFELAGIKGDLGALVMGVLLASHPAADELRELLFSVRELLLVGFFVSIGYHGVPSLEQALLAVLVLALIPVKSVGYVVLLRLLRLRNRTAVLSGVVLAQFSEFGLIVAAVGHSAGWIDEEWVVVIAVAVALSFTVAGALNGQARRIADAATARMPEDAGTAEDADQEIDDANVLVIGMGQIGVGALQRFRDHWEWEAVGVEHDPQRATQLRDEGLNVITADATDAEFWQRMLAGCEVDIVLLAMPRHGANVAALDVLRSQGFSGTVACIARYDDELEELERREVDVAFRLSMSAGTAVADAAAQDRSERLDP